MKNILYLSYDGMTDPLGQSQVIPYLGGLRKKGYRIWLISFEKPAAYAENKVLIRNICMEAGIEWYPLRYTKKPAVISALFDIWQMKRMAAKICRKHTISLVHCRSYISSMTGVWIKKKYSIPFIFDMRGFWPDERVDGKLWDLNNPLYRQVYNFFKQREKLFLEQAAHTICLTYESEKEIHSWKHIQNNPVKITVIPCCADMDHFDPDRISDELKNEWRARLKIKDGERILSYVGSLGTWYMVEEMLDFFRIQLQSDTDIRFLFITLDRAENILEMVKIKGIDPEKIIIYAGSRNDMPALISLSDYAIFFIIPAYSKMASSPTKQAEIMRLGIPLICNDRIGDTSYVVDKYNAGIIIREFNTASYRNAIETLTKTVFDKKGIRQGALEFYNLETGIERYRQVYSEILSN